MAIDNKVMSETVYIPHSRVMENIYHILQTLLPVWHPVGLYTNITLLPEYLKKIGYQTHAFGK